MVYLSPPVKRKEKIHFHYYFCYTTPTSRFYPTSTSGKQTVSADAGLFIYSCKIIIMKKLLFLFCAFIVCTTIISCRFHNNVNISYSDSDHYYKMKARFSRSRTLAVERYMDDMLATANMSFRHTRIDGQIALGDHSTFYIKKYSGFLYIKFDKDENSDEAYYRIKSMCEGIKRVLVH